MYMYKCFGFTIFSLLLPYNDEKYIAIQIVSTNVHYCLIMSIIKNVSVTVSFLFLSIKL